MDGPSSLHPTIGWFSSIVKNQGILMDLTRRLAQSLVLALLIRNSCFSLQQLSGREIYQKQCARCHDNFAETGALSPILLHRLSSERILAALESGRMKDQGALLTQAQRHIVALYLSA